MRISLDPCLTCVCFCGSPTHALTNEVAVCLIHASRSGCPSVCTHIVSRAHLSIRVLSLWFQLNTERHIRRKLPSGALVLRAIDHSVSVSALAMCPAHLCSSCCLCLFGSTSHVFTVSFPLLMPFFPPFYRVAASAFRNLVVPAMILALHVVSCVAMLSLEFHKRDPPHLIWPCCVCMRFRTQTQRWTRTVQYFVSPSHVALSSHVP